MEQKLQKEISKFPNITLTSGAYTWDGKSKAKKLIESARRRGNLDHLIIVGHSFGADEANSLADDISDSGKPIDYLIQIDSVGTYDDNTPKHVINHINYYQTIDWEWKVLREYNIPGAININVNDGSIIDSRGVESKSEPLAPEATHKTIDDAPKLHQDIIKRVMSGICTTREKDERKGDKKRGRNFGDPHLFTFDGYRYSFQLVGEFILTKSEDNLFEVQVRQSPVSSSLSVDSAIAMRMGNNRVALYADELPDNDRRTPLRVDGVPTLVNRELTLDGGGQIYHNGSNYVFKWPTGEELIAQINANGETPFINITTYVFESQANHLSGLFGNANGDTSDELRFRDGSVLPSREAYGNIDNLIGRSSSVRLPLNSAFNLYLKKLTQDYGNDWRISQEESLFDYAPGQNTKTFTLTNFPSEYLALEQLSSTELSNARATCIETEVDPELMEGCVFDVAFSGRSDFARAAAKMSQTADILRQFGINVPNVEQEIRKLIPGLPGGIRIPGVRF
ncbi:MAG: hypothetical protein F6K26_31160 [Moorea sp. SIO2I5]|nr:hypothetical protein [Moorena sp. SIO2I5]